VLEARDISLALRTRDQDSRVLDVWGGLRPTYNTWHQQILDVYNLYAGNWGVIWPDNVRTLALPKIPNFPQLASDDRARSVAATKPSIVCRPEKAGDKSQAMADKRERIIGGYWGLNRVTQMTSRWAHDAMAGGLMAVRVLPDFDRPIAERYPVFRRLEPALCYPDPVFTAGPFCDSFIYAYEENIRTVEKRYNVDLSSWKKYTWTRNDKLRVVEYYDDTWAQVMLEAIPRGQVSGQKAINEIVMAEQHGLGKCPVAVGARPTMDGVYRGEFYGGMGVLNYWNKMMTMVLDDATNKVYPAKLVYDVENPEEWGPDAQLEAQSPNARFEFIQPPNQPFTNIQILHDLAGFARTSAILPPSRSGDPNESIISAAGISATQSQYVEDVRSIQRDMITPMLEAANELALIGDEMWCNVEKPIYGEKTGQAYKETYLPSKDINGYHRSEVQYGTFSGLDEINQNVLILQQWGNGDGLISERTAMEVSPLVQDVNRELKQKTAEKLQRAALVGLEQQAASGQLDPATLARIWSAVENDDMTLTEAIATHATAAPLAPPGPAAPGAAQAPGIAGAQGAQPGAARQMMQQQNMPSLKSLMGTG
jgi:hypothetical protein